MENGVNVNVQVQGHEGLLEAASRSDAKTIARLLMDKGAVATHRTMEVASKRGNGEVQKSIRNALESQSSGTGSDAFP